jgi:hypothetical protein
MDATPRLKRSEHLLRGILVALALVVVGWGVLVVARYGWRDLFADGWRLYANALTLGFPGSVLALENGHRPILPALLRAAELYWLDADHRLQWIAGLGLALGSVVAAWWIVLRDRDVHPVSRAAAMVATGLAVFWLGNARMLLHPLEAVQTYLVVLALVIGAALAAEVARHPGASSRALAGCVACAFIATFAFGTGVVAFPALAVALLAARAPLRSMGVLAAGLTATLALYFALPAGAQVARVVALDPWRNLQAAAQWLAAPVATLAAGPQHARGAPVPLVPRLAGWDEWPSAATFIGLAAIASLVVATFAVWREGRPTRTQVLGITLSGFALGAALLVGLTRLAYFEAHPGQLFASRYLPWGCLMWAGLALIALGRRRAARLPSLRPAMVVVLAATVAGLLQAPHYQQWARHSQAVHRHHAIAVLADLWSTSRMQGESLTADVAAAVPLLRQHRVAMFAHPAAMRLGTPLNEARHGVVAPPQPAHAEPYRSDRGHGAVDFTVDVPDGVTRERIPLWVVTDANLVVVGYAHPHPLRSRGTLAGIARMPGADGRLHAYPWRDDDVAGPGFVLVVPPAARTGATPPA